ncbi:acyloxyacyl hydrolase [Bowmanella sp. Y26]|uniref:acyloxyacyl hydrolase n=1 Tax=Bowmanella yangjiangensis TaxID=2811230 RepID=UPI001BDCE800|nr:acyloxyacyl hydrolase [Bowmanella yangjiangensis]MBT1063341.1 acyloxyacyl hydrolase [Bowmanella yangjiangensis]
MFKNAFLISLLFISSYLPANQLSGKYFSIDYIRGEGNVEGIKVAYQIHGDFLDEYTSLFDVYFESSVNFWEYGEQNKHDKNFVLSLSPVFRYEMGVINNSPVLFEVGVGVSLLNDTQFAGKNVSTHYQFEDRVGIVYKYGSQHEYTFSVRYFHYSNAGFKKPNPGLDFIAVSIAKKF